MAEIYVSATLRNTILNAITGRAKEADIAAGSAYLALSSTAPTYDVSGEITGITEPEKELGYARHRLGIADEPSTKEMSDAFAGQTANKDEIHFDQIPADGSGWGDDAAYWAIYSTKTGGTPIAAGALTSAVTLEAGKVVIIHRGNLTIDMNLVSAT